MKLSQEKTDILNKYASIKTDIKSLEATADELKGQVLEIMQNEDVQEIELLSGKLTLSSRRSWKYTLPVQEKEKELKELKKNEEMLGIAQYSELFYPVYSVNKE